MAENDRRSAAEFSTGLVWRKSSGSASNDEQCVEIAMATGRVLVRDSKHAGRMLDFARAEWRAFVAALPTP